MNNSSAFSAHRSALPPRVCVVVLTHNRRDEVMRTVERLRALPERPPIIVVDNGSRDGTGQALRRSFPDVEVAALPDNRGAAGRNAGVQCARTPYVAFSDDDTWWAPGAIGHAADVLDAHPGVAVVTGRVMVEPDGREDPTSAEMARSPLGAVPGLNGMRILGCLAGASVMRRDAFLAAGGYQARFFLGGEEWLLAMDLATAGWTLAYVPSVVAHHQPSRARDAGGRRRLLLRNALWSAWLRLPWPAAATQTIRLARRARDHELLAATVVDAARGLPWVWRERRVLPPAVVEAWRRIGSPT